MINFDQIAESLERQHRTESSAVKTQFDQITQAIQSHLPSLNAAATAVQTVSDQLGQVLKQQAAAAPSPAETPTPTGSANAGEGEI